MPLITRIFRITRPAGMLVLVAAPGIGVRVLSDQMVRIEPAKAPASFSIRSVFAALHPVAKAVRCGFRRLRALRQPDAGINQEYVVAEQNEFAGNIADQRDRATITGGQSPALIASIRLRNWLIAE